MLRIASLHQAYHKDTEELQVKQRSTAPPTDEIVPKPPTCRSLMIAPRRRRSPLPEIHRIRHAAVGGSSGRLQIRGGGREHRQPTIHAGCGSGSITTGDRAEGLAESDERIRRRGEDGGWTLGGFGSLSAERRRWSSSKGSWRVGTGSLEDGEPKGRKLTLGRMAGGSF